MIYVNEELMSQIISFILENKINRKEAKGLIKIYKIIEIY